MKINQDQTITSKTDFFYYAFRNILLFCLPLTLISALILSLSHSSAANNSSDKLSLNIPISCTMSSSGSDSHTTSMISGQRKENIGTTTINTVCNDKNGYAIYAMGTTQNSSGEPVLSSVIGSDYDIKTGTAEAGTGVSSWAMKLTAVTGDNQMPPDMVNTYTSYTSAPNSWTKVASRSSGTSSLVGSAFTTTYAIYTTPSQPAGAYTGEVSYIMLHPSTTPAPTTTLDNAFAGANKTRLILKTDGTTVEEGSAGSEDIPEEDIVGRYYKMQDMNSGICDATTYVDTAAETQLIDIRDNKTYYVTKLRDGHCWMTQNLALDLSTTKPLTSNDTDLNDNSLSGAYELGYTYENNILSWKPANTTKTFNGTSVSGWISSTTTPSSARKTDGILTGHTTTGNYYNWSAAIASNDSNSLTDNNSNANNSICPKNWRLPNITDNEFTTLNNLYNNGSNFDDTGLTISPLWFVRNGYINGSSLFYYDAGGDYWSSTVYNNNVSYFLYIGTNVVNTAFSLGYHGSTFGDYKHGGRSIRCLAR